MATAGMILGIIAVVFGFIPVLGAFVTIPCMLIGLPLSGIGLHQSIKNETGKGQAIAGIATNCVAIFIVLIWIVLVAAASA